MDKFREMDAIKNEFSSPSPEYKSIPKWVWNKELKDITKEEIREQLRNFRDHDGYRGLMIVLWGYDGYMTEEYMEKYGYALDAADELGMKIIIWDENGFPTGYAGGFLEEKYPEFTAKRLEMDEEDIEGPVMFSKRLPEGRLMGIVAMNSLTGERVDITHCADQSGRVVFDVPEGSWKICIFTCVREDKEKFFTATVRFLDYLDSNAVKKFIELTHQKYYDRFPHHFGTTIKYAFYDEPSFWHVKEGRIWTNDYNLKFEEKYGYSPVSYYPALWYDIGEDTQAARNALLEFRAELYSQCFVKELGDWCRDHGITLTGHMDQEEIVSPVSLHGDLMKVFRYQDIPGVDEIMKYGRGSKAYKLVSSAAFNYDKPLVMCETYGAMGEEMPVNVLYKEAVDLYAKGINFMVPHGTWYDNINNVTFPPELSYRSKKFGPELPAYNEYIGRLGVMLQGGRHIADIGILYPIAALQAGYRFGPENPYLGGVIPEEADYMDLGEILSTEVRMDYTYVHPEVLDEKCIVEGSEILLGNDTNYERYKVFIIPGAKVIHLSNLKKIKAFFDNGGKVVATRQLPFKSAEFGRDNEVREIINEMFGMDPCGKEALSLKYRVNSGSNGGQACFIPEAGREVLDEVLNRILDVYDVRLPRASTVQGGYLTYIHKVKFGQNIYFFANSGDDALETEVRLRGRFDCEIWDPHTGTISETLCSHTEEKGQSVTIIKLVLEPVSSVFVVGQEI